MCARRRLVSATGAVLLAFAIGLLPTIAKRTGTTGVPPVGEQQTGTTGVPPVADGLTDSLRFSAIDVYSNGTATLAVAWPPDLIPTNTTIDILSATSLVNSAWVWQCSHTVAEGETNWIVTVALPWIAPGTNAPSAFCRALHRESCADTMDDTDGDGLPNVYELAHGRNPWVDDYALVQKLTVGPDGEFGDIVSALAASEEYSVIAVTSGVHQVNDDIQMPPHPVMVTCEDGYAVFSGSSRHAMFLLGNGHDSGHTLFRNLYLNLTSTSGMQAGFWCGGGLPWEAPGAAAVSRVLFDASFTNAWPMARFENADDFHVTMTDCIRPSEPASSDFMPDATNSVHIVTSQVAWAGFPLADSPAAALRIGAFAPIPHDSLDDTDHDTLLDYNEVYERGLDPFNADTDNDGVSDSDEIAQETDPADPHSFKQNLTVTVTNTVSTTSAVYTAWGFSETGWESDGLAAFPEGFGATNYIDASSQGATHIKAFCDLNGNGTFDADFDILLVHPIPPRQHGAYHFHVRRRGRRRNARRR